MLGTLEKVGQVLALFTREHPEWGVTEVARALDLPKSSAHALLATLSHIGLLKRNRKGRYRIGWRVLALSQILLSTSSWREEARKAMEDLVARYGETAHLAVLECGRVIYVEKLEGTRAVKVATTGVGVELPAHCSAVGKVLLAHRPWEEVLEIVREKGLPPLTPNTITSLDELGTELKAVRARGYAYDIEEAVPELCCVAAPIRDATGEVIAAMSLSVPFYRFQQMKEEYRRAILEATRTVSERLGYVEETWTR
ncbi:IclR family transcriptional regulator [Thermus scotoductus]|uniref:IclR family transcriptional regulator n=1 Tax=Thermus scotoductus TaxID=37636 RepID=A0A430VSR3_THESC|nr:IclR family transcriptional regulator [Thermus scotoductus]RTG95926.1 IclR family transcriptional regulator [Thermus scotoductus]RTH03079.1 IclR family transcriptional regulator [Thermus scotoductus]RTH16884.1 IclR family transcriptional regulator [Thermus scotoductus]RTI02386.1 IclR family transcriptional regulator [Thermus scotoductus]RTI18581.1 IclR family transcriptional regulator [Thermus scotoductus]